MTEQKDQPIIFYCRDCQKVVLDPPRKSKKYAYNCPICKGDRVSFGTREAICDFFHIKEAMYERMLANPNEK